MRVLTRNVLMLLGMLTVAGHVYADQPPCNPYEATCLIGTGGTFTNPYTQPTGGINPGMGPYGPPGTTPTTTYTPPASTLSYAMLWAINGELYLDQGANRYGWLIVENLANVPQVATIEYTSEAWAVPAYRFVSLPPKARVSVSLHGDVILASGYFSAHVYFEARGATHATFRPHSDDTQGQTSVAAALIP